MDIFVGSIPFKFKDNDLIALFEPYGEVVSAQIIIDKSTRQNKGFGFVEMADKEEALKAIAELDGTEQSGRRIVVAEAKRKKDEEIIRKPSFKKKKKKKRIITWGE